MNKKENDRAFRISYMTEGIHESITIIYESLVDREYDSVKEEIKLVSREFRAIIKLIEDDDF